MITREEAHTSCLSRDCSCINGKDRDCNYHETIDKIYDEFEQHIKSLEAQLNTEQLSCDGCK